MSETDFGTQGQKPKIKVSFTIGMVIILTAVLAWLFFISLEPSIDPYRVNCAHNLSRLGIVISVYADDHNGKYPAADKWCDLLKIYFADDPRKVLVCGGALKKGEKKRCHYAINPNAEPNSPPDIVLLFETKGGWNQYGGPELLTMENHEGKGCNILFNDGHVQFVKPERLSELIWKDEQKQ